MFKAIQVISKYLVLFMTNVHQLPKYGDRDNSRQRIRQCGCDFRAASSDEGDYLDDAIC